MTNPAFPGFYAGNAAVITALLFDVVRHILVVVTIQTQFILLFLAEEFVAIGTGLFKFDMSLT